MAAAALAAMLEAMLLCYITDRRQLPGNGEEQSAQLLDAISHAAAAGVNYILLREKDLSARGLETLAKTAVERVRRSGGRSRLLIHSRVDVAIAARADGAHFPASDLLFIGEARVIFSKAGVARPVIDASCHTLAEVQMAESQGADFAVFGPVFEKDGKPGSGLEALRTACARAGSASSRMPVLALGGVTMANASSCMDAGAAGVAGIRLFQAADVKQHVEALRGISPRAAAEERKHPYGL
jgi:thiamine-phosphate pyrophosphorylase